MTKLTAAQIRERVTEGSPALPVGTAVDAWIEETRDVFLDALAQRDGVRYAPTPAIKAVRVPGCTDRLVLPWVKVTSIDSIEVGGSEVDPSSYDLDADAGIVYGVGGYTWHPARAATVSCIHGYAAWPDPDDEDAPEPTGDECPVAVLQAQALFVECSYAARVAGSGRNVARQGFEGGSSTVYLRAGGRDLTAFADVNDLVAHLPSYRIPGIA